MSRTISNHDDVIDSRDVIERLEELREEREALVTECENWTSAQGDVDPVEGDDTEVREGLRRAGDALAEWDAENGEELAALAALAEEAEGYAADWRYGETLIRRSYFKEYAQQLAEDCGMINPKATWPNNCIDWDEAARQLEMDYTSVDFAGVEYLIR